MLCKSIHIYIYIYIYTHTCVCVCFASMASVPPSDRVTVRSAAGDVLVELKVHDLEPAARSSRPWRHESKIIEEVRV